MSRERILTNADACRIVSGANMIRYTDQSPLPNYIRFVESEAPVSNQMEAWIKKQFKLSGDYGFQELNRTKDELGFEHIRYRETYKGIPIQGTMYIAHALNGRILSLGGVLYQGIPNLNNLPNLSESAALQLALAKVNANTYKWQIPQEESLLKIESQNNSATYYPKGETFILKVQNAYHLCYAFNIYAHEPMGRTMEYVDAHTGKILLSKNLIEHVNVNGTAVTKYSGTQTFQTDSTAANSFRLRDASRGLGVNTYNLNNATTYGGATDFTDNDNYWNNVNVDQDEAATDAHWGAQKTYDYFMNKHNRNSIDDAGYQLKSYVHYNNNYANAFWDGTRMTYGDGNVNQGFMVMTALDVCAHEIGHGLTNFTADLSATSSGSDECDALNEAYSDVFGTAVEKYARPTQWDWVIGGDITCTSAGVPDGQGIRNMSNPTLLGQPKCYQGTNWDPNGECHQNDGPLIYWYYLLSTGSTTYTVSPLGTDTAGKIAFRALTVHLFPNANYADARFYSIVASTELYGGCSTPTIATTNAWSAVCVGSPYVAGPTVSSFSGDILQTCDTTLTVQFTNTSTNGNSFLWTFGDGTTSTQYNPVHTYSSGIYTVKLVVNGGTCGIDSLTQTSYIQVGPPPGPSTTGATLCSPGTALLTATPNVVGDTIRWYTAAIGGTSVATGTSFTTPVLSANTTYYAEEKIAAPVYHIGPLNNSIGGGGNYTNTTRFMVFDCSQPTILQSVWVFAQGAGNRTIILKDAGGATLQSVTVNIPSGGSVVTLNMPIPVGTGMQLGLATGSTVNLYRNSSGASYPYSNGPITITGNTAPGSPGYYYFFYDWVVKGDDCYSVRTPTNVLVGSGGSVPATISTSGSLNVCAPNTVTLNANTGAGLSYQWYNGTTLITGATGASYTASTSGSYHVVVSSSSGCLTPGTSAATAVTITSVPTVGITPVGNTTFCSGGSVVLNATGANSYVWSNGLTGNSITVTTPGTITVTGSTNGCSATSSGVNVTVNPSPSVNVTPAGNTTFCAGGSVVLNASGANSYVWSNSQTGNSITVTQSGTYSVTGTTSGCTGTSTSVAVVVNPLPNVTITPAGSTSFCPGGSVLLNAGGANTYSWSGGQSGSSITVTQSGSYTVTGTSAANCSAVSAPVNITLYPAPTASFVVGSNVSGNVTFNNTSTGATLYDWDFGDGGTSQQASPSHQYTGSGSFTVTLIVTSANGCKDTFVQTISAEVTGIQDWMENLGWQVYPNPVDDILQLTFNKSPFSGSIRIFDAVGQLLFEREIENAKEYSIPVRSWSAGHYYVTLSNHSQKQTIPILKSK
ncbi:MAG: M4 family metallopeptidase [Chitinophagaceae bacterium]|nr:M4 family metallopeptidase [Chitinophagaceae bacterium]